MRIYVDVLRGIPSLVLILFSYYGLALIGLNISAFSAGVVALSGFCIAHMAETFRGAIHSLPTGQTEPAKALGLTFPPGTDAQAVGSGPIGSLRLDLGGRRSLKHKN